MNDAQLKALVDGYLVCLLWVMPGDDECENPGDSLSIHCDLADGVRAEAETHCREFLAKCGSLATAAVERIGYGPEQFGHDFALTRNGHGVGFADREQLRKGDLGHKLRNLCSYREKNLYVGDDGKAYFE